MFTLQFYLTGFVLAAAILIAARMVVIEKLPRTDLNPRLIPTTPVLIVSGNDHLTDRLSHGICLADSQ